MNMDKDLESLKAEIIAKTREYSRLAHAMNRPGDSEANLYNASGPAIPMSAPYAGRVFDEDEVAAAVDATLDFWLTLGKEGDALSEELAQFLGVKFSILTNSGSSANLLAFSALTSHKLPPARRLRPGDEVITCAAGFPTTVAPIIQNRCVPVFLDNDPITGNARLELLEEAYTPGKTKAVMMAHTLGNPFNLGRIVEFCHQHELWLIEDNCDALGCTYTLPLAKAAQIGLDHLIKLARQGSNPRVVIEGNAGEETLSAPTGSFGDLSTQSFYPPHHLTMGEGGAVNVVRRGQLKTLVESFRDWGRDCWCPSGKDNTCNKRFGWQLGELPYGYDHKYIYSHLGYNIKPLDTQAAIGRQQMKKLPAFIEARKKNWDYLRKGLSGLEAYFEFSLPTHASGWSTDGFGWDDSRSKVDCSWFGFMLLVRPGLSFTKAEFASYLDSKRIGNRMLFGGNLLRQPVFVQLKQDEPEAYRVVGELSGADRIMNEAVFIGVYPGLAPRQLEYMVEAIKQYINHI